MPLPPNRQKTISHPEFMVYEKTILRGSGIQYNSMAGIKGKNRKHSD